MNESYDLTTGQHGWLSVARLLFYPENLPPTVELPAYPVPRVSGHLLGLALLAKVS